MIKFLLALFQAEANIVICFNPSGNHSNRLFQNLHLEAFCYDNGIQFLNPTFADMKMLYKNPVQTSCSSIFRAAKYPLRVLSKLKTFDSIVSFEEFDPKYLAFLRNRNGIVLVEGWGFRAYTETKKHHSFFKYKYTLRDRFISDLMLLDKIQSFKDSGRLVVGLHVRRGDYAIYERGKYYFTDERYYGILHETKEEIGSAINKDIEFIVFSNEAVDFKGCLVSQNEWFVDHHLMMQCDYLIGPPSTFTMWASYIGRVPYLHVTNDSSVNIMQFSICDG